MCSNSTASKPWYDTVQKLTVGHCLSACRFVDNDEDIYEEHQSVHKARLGQQQVLHVSLDDCLRLFTKEEKVMQS